MFEDKYVQEQYDRWMSAGPIEDDILSEEELRNRVIKDLTDVSCMPVEEYTLYQKYLEIQKRYLHFLAMNFRLEIKNMNNLFVNVKITFGFQKTNKTLKT